MIKVLNYRDSCHKDYTNPLLSLSTGSRTISNGLKLQPRIFRLDIKKPLLSIRVANHYKRLLARLQELSHWMYLNIG